MKGEFYMNYEEQIMGLRGASKEKLKQIIFEHDQRVSDSIESMAPEDVTKDALFRIHQRDVYVQNLLINALFDRTE